MMKFLSRGAVQRTRLQRVVLTALPFLLTACASIGLPTTDRRDAIARDADSRISSKCQQHMNSLNALGSNIECVVFNGLVLLVGQAPNANSRTQAENTAKSMTGVRRVVTEVTEGPSTGFLRNSSDSLITAGVKTGLLANPKIKAGDVKVETVQGVVYLLGILSKNESDLAVNIARNGTGVRKVVDLTEALTVR